jgi:glycosyltransferase involved in cell wall biosynthesis
MTAPPRVSIVIPVYNEEAILEPALGELGRELEQLPFSYEIVLAENGSTDGTVAVAERLRAKDDRIRMLCIGEPNYGRALREGILAAVGELVICEEIDLCDTDFQRRAVALIDDGGAELVIGSKLTGGARDERPLFRHLASLAYTRLLRVLFDFRGTDTHGLKAFRRERLLPVVRACRVDKDVFSSEFVIRAARAGVHIAEIPVRVNEKRPPSINLMKRVPNVVSNLGKLFWVIRVADG